MTNIFSAESVDLLSLLLPSLRLRSNRLRRLYITTIIDVTATDLIGRLSGLIPDL